MSSNRIKTLEHGDLYFFFRPRVEEECPEKLEEVQRSFYGRALSAELLKRSSCSALLSRCKLNVMERRGASVRRMAKDCSFRIRRPSKQKNCNLVHARKNQPESLLDKFPKHRYMA